MKQDDSNKDKNNKQINGKMKNIHKYILDLIMTVIIVILMKIFFTGLLLHEILGITVFIIVVIHQLFNFKYTKSLFKNFFKKYKIKL